MHSKIFQVSKKPVKPDEYFDEDRYFNYWDFVPRIADYVDDSLSAEEVKSCIEYLGKYDGITTDTLNRTVCVTDKSSYFVGKYNSVMKVINGLKSMTLDEFCTMKRSMDFSDLKYYYDDGFGFYTDSKDEGLMTLDEWVRSVKEGETYHIGAVIDYHF